MDAPLETRLGMLALLSGFMSQVKVIAVLWSSLRDNNFFRNCETIKAFRTDIHRNELLANDAMIPN